MELKLNILSRKSRERHRFVNLDQYNSTNVAHPSNPPHPSRGEEKWSLNSTFEAGLAWKKAQFVMYGFRRHRGPRHSTGEPWKGQEGHRDPSNRVKQ